MSTVLESPPQVTSAPPRGPTAAPPRVTPPTTRRRTVAIVVAVVVAIAALVGIGVAIWTVNQPTTTTTTPIYTDAVPHPGAAAAAMYAARNTATFQGYGPGSTIYAEQVPALAAVTAVPETFGYGSRDYQAYRAPAPVTVVPRLHQAAPFEWTTATVVPPPHQAAPFEYVTVPGPTVVPRLHQAAPFE